MDRMALDGAPPDGSSGDVRLPAPRGGSAAEAPGGRLGPVRSVHFHDPCAPRATVVVPSVFVAVRNPLDQVLLVRRCDSGLWELPGGRVDVGESAVTAAVLPGVATSTKSMSSRSRRRR